MFQCNRTIIITSNSEICCLGPSSAPTHSNSYRVVMKHERRQRFSVQFEMINRRAVELREMINTSSLEN